MLCMILMLMVSLAQGSATGLRNREVPCPSVWLAYTVSTSMTYDITASLLHVPGALHSWHIQIYAIFFGVYQRCSETPASVLQAEQFRVVQVQVVVSPGKELGLLPASRAASSLGMATYTQSQNCRSPNGFLLSRKLSCLVHQSQV